MSSGFITESEIEARKLERQQEWDKVRKPEDPAEAPEEPAPDHRSLFDRLQEQKMKKQEEFEEAHKLKNLVKGLDDDEADFLETVDKAKMDLERQKRLEEVKALNEFRSKMAELREQELNKHIQQELGLLKKPSAAPAPKSSGLDFQELPSIGTRKTPQSKLLAGVVVKRKAPTAAEKEDPAKKARAEDGAAEPPKKVEASSSTGSKGATPPVLRVLPGLASYSDSSASDDDDSSDESERGSSVPRDLCGRQLLSEGDANDADSGKKK